MLEKILKFFNNITTLEKKLEEQKGTIIKYYNAIKTLKEGYLKLKNKSNIYEKASELFNEILSSMNSGVLLLLPKYEEHGKVKIIFINKFLLNMVGYSKQEVIDDPNLLINLVEGPYLNELYQNVSKLKHNKADSFYMNLSFKNISNCRKVISMNGKSVNIDNRKCIILTINDLTVESEYKYKSNLFSSLFLSASISALILDINNIYEWVKVNREKIKNDPNYIEFNMVSLKDHFKNIIVKSINKTVIELLNGTSFYDNKDAFIEKLFYANKKTIIEMVMGIFNNQEDTESELYLETSNGIQFLINIKLIIPAECYKNENFNQILLISKNYNLNESVSDSTSSNKDLMQWREDSKGNIVFANTSALEDFFSVKSLNDLANNNIKLETTKSVKEFGRPCKFFLRKQIGIDHYWFSIWSTPMYNIKGSFIGIINLVFNKIKETEEFLNKLSNQDYDSLIKISEDLYYINLN